MTENNGRESPEQLQTNHQDDVQLCFGDLEASMISQTGLNEACSVVKQKMASSLNKSNRRSRCISSGVGLAMLVFAALGVHYFANQKGYTFKRDRATLHKDYQEKGVSVESMVTHNDAMDCWMELHGNIYDLTAFIPRHPGGPDYVTSHCGTNATEAWDMEHSISLLGLVSSYNLGRVISENGDER